MKIKNLIKQFLSPPSSMLFLISLFFIFIFFITDQSSNEDSLFLTFYQSTAFVYLGFFSIIILLSRVFNMLNISIVINKWIEDKKRKTKGWPLLEEEVALESLFYSGITFDELYQFCQFANDVSFIAFTENNLAMSQHCTVLARNDEDKYWLSYFRFNERSIAKVKMVYLIISNFMEVFTGDPVYKKELKEQAMQDSELRGIDTSKLLIAILAKEDVKKVHAICEKYYKMIIEKRLEGKY